MAKPSSKQRAIGGSFKPARRPPLHRDRVVEAAIAILDAEGPDALTFRRLAADLGVGVATLYWHVDNKDALLQLALDQVLGEIEGGFDVDPDGPWDERLRDGFAELRRVLGRHPWAAALAMVSIERGPNLLRHWDRAATLMLDAGFDPREAFYGLSALFTFVVGAATQNAMWHSYAVDDDGAIRRETLAQATEFFASLDPEAYPSFQRVTPVIATHDEEEQFLAGLDLLIAGLRARAPKRRRAKKA